MLDLKKLLIVKRAEGIEPSSLAWKAKVLPLNYARFKGALKALLYVLYIIHFFKKEYCFLEHFSGFQWNI